LPVCPRAPKRNLSNLAERFEAPAMLRFLALALLMLLPPISAHAQDTVTIPITFNGVVTTSLGDPINIRQADGGFTPYAGPVPTFPYTEGQAVTISFNATVPSAAWLASHPEAAVYAADGVYRITLLPDANAASAPAMAGYGAASGVNISTGFAPADNPRSGGDVMAMTLLFNSNTNTYTIATIHDATFVAGYFAGPDYVYDGNSGHLVACSGAACDPVGNAANLFTLVGDADGGTVAASNIPILDSITGELAGLFSFGLTGGWSLGGSATKVPEPGMLGMFAVAALVPVLRRRRAMRRG